MPISAIDDLACHQHPLCRLTTIPSHIDPTILPFGGIPGHTRIPAGWSCPCLLFGSADTGRIGADAEAVAWVLCRCPRLPDQVGSIQYHCMCDRPQPQTGPARMTLPLLAQRQKIFRTCPVRPPRAPLSAMLPCPAHITASAAYGGHSAHPNAELSQYASIAPLVGRVSLTDAAQAVRLTVRPRCMSQVGATRPATGSTGCQRHHVSRMPGQGHAVASIERQTVICPVRAGPYRPPTEWQHR